MKLAWGYIIFVVICLSIGVIAFIFGEPLMQVTGDATQVAVTLFSILAGFLIAIMTLLGDHAAVPGSWRIAEGKRKKINQQLYRQQALFVIYLITLSMIFVHEIIEDQFIEFASFLERVYYSFSVFALLLSFSLPNTLRRLQSERADAIVEARRAKAPPLQR